MKVAYIAYETLDEGDVVFLDAKDGTVKRLIHHDHSDALIIFNCSESTCGGSSVWIERENDKSINIDLLRSLTNAYHDCNEEDPNKLKLAEAIEVILKKISYKS